MSEEEAEEGGGAVGLEILTVTDEEVVVFPAASRAVGVIVYEPLGTVVVSQESEKGAVVSSAPKFFPFSWNWMPTTPILSVAVATISTVPERVLPLVGAVRNMDGGVMSSMVTLIGADVVVCPAASREIAVRM